MMIPVNWWLDDETPDRPSWNCYVVEDPTINYTDRPYGAMQAGLVRVYNERQQTALTAGDFAWQQTARPAPQL